MAFPQLRMIGDLWDSQIGHAYLMTQFRLRCSESPGKKCIPCYNAQIYSRKQYVYSLVQKVVWVYIASFALHDHCEGADSFISHAFVTLPGPHHHTERVSNPVREAGALPRRPKATASSVSC